MLLPVPDWYGGGCVSLSLWPVLTSCVCPAVCAGGEQGWHWGQGSTTFPQVPRQHAPGSRRRGLENGRGQVLVQELPRAPGPGLRPGQPKLTPESLPPLCPG